MHRRRLRSEESEEWENSTINLTPLIDVVFVVLITFIVIAPLLKVEDIQLASGVANSPAISSAQEKSPLAIYVRANDTIWVNDQLVSLEELREWLNKVHYQYPKAIPQLFQDKRAQFGTYQNVKNAVEAAGFSDLHLILIP